MPGVSRASDKMSSPCLGTLDVGPDARRPADKATGLRWDVQRLRGDTGLWLRLPNRRPAKAAYRVMGEGSDMFLRHRADHARCRRVRRCPWNWCVLRRAFAARLETGAQQPLAYELPRFVPLNAQERCDVRCRGRVRIDPEVGLGTPTQAAVGRAARDYPVLAAS